MIKFDEKQKRVAITEFWGIEDVQKVLEESGMDYDIPEEKLWAILKRASDAYEEDGGDMNDHINWAINVLY